MMPLRSLGHSPIRITAIGLGCWQFSEGGGLGGNYWPTLSADLENRIVAASLAAGINWFDSAEAYGAGRSEAALARALVAAGRKNGDVVVATKWMPLLRTAASITKTIAERRARLAPFDIDLHQIHHPIAFASTAAQMNAMADLVETGAIRTVGVSNFTARRMRKAHAALARRGLPLVSNQMRYSLVHRGIETNGVLDAARELGITIIAYSPLAQGLLSGKYHRDQNLIRARSGPRKWLPDFRRGALERSRPLVAALDEVAAAHGATASQVALNWLVHAHGETVVVIPGATSVEQARENAGSLGFTLTVEESLRLDELSRRFR